MLRLGRGEEKARATRLRLAARCTGTVRAGARHRRCRCTGTAAPAVPRCTTVQAFGPHRRCRCRPPAYSCTLVHGVHLHRVYCGGPRPRYTLCSHGSCADVRAQTVARGRTARVRLCPWILQAPTMPATIGTKNKMRTRVERREKPSDLWIPYPREPTRRKRVIRSFVTDANCFVTVLLHEHDGIPSISSTQVR